MFALGSGGFCHVFPLNIHAFSRLQRCRSLVALFLPQGSGERLPFHVQLCPPAAMWFVSVLRVFQRSSSHLSHPSSSASCSFPPSLVRSRACGGSLERTQGHTGAGHVLRRSQEGVASTCLQTLVVDVIVIVHFSHLLRASRLLVLHVARVSSESHLVPRLDRHYRSEDSAQPTQQSPMQTSPLLTSSTADHLLSDLKHHTLDNLSHNVPLIL